MHALHNDSLLILKVRCFCPTMLGTDYLESQIICIDELGQGLLCADKQG